MRCVEEIRAEQNILDVGGGSVGVASKSDANLANVSLGWMVKEAILGDANLVFREDAFESYPGVAEVVWPYIPAEEDASSAGGARTEEGPVDAEDIRTRTSSEKDQVESSKNLIVELATIFNCRDKVLSAETGHQADTLNREWSSKPKKEDRTNTDPEIERLKQEDVVVRDACAVMRDQLDAARGWWILEWIPFIETRVHPAGYTTRGFR